MYPPLRVKVHQKYTKTTLKNHLIAFFLWARMGCATLALVYLECCNICEQQLFDCLATIGINSQIDKLPHGHFSLFWV